jgi:hypothetical protein
MREFPRAFRLHRSAGVWAYIRDYGVSGARFMNRPSEERHGTGRLLRGTESISQLRISTLERDELVINLKRQGTRS